MQKLTTASLFFLAAGIFTSVTVLSAYQILYVFPLAYCSYLAFKNKDLKLPASAYWLLAFTAVALLSLAVNYDLVPKPSKNFGRLKYFIFGVGGIFVVRAWVNDASDKIKKYVASTFMISIVVAGLFMIYKSIGIPVGHRVRGLTDTMRYGYGTGMILLSLISGILHREKNKSWFDWKLAIVAVISGLIGVYLTETRGAFLGLICGLPFVLYFYSPKWGLRIGGVSLAGLLLIGAFYLFGTGTMQGPRLLMNKNNKSDNIRRSLWQSAIIATTEKPFLGWGFSNFHTQLKRIKTEHDLPEKDYDDAHSHNLFLEVASGTGLIGLFLFLGWIIMWAKEAFQAGGLTRALIFPFGVSFVISSQFEVTFDANNASMIFMMYAFTYLGTTQRS
jgi:O-antigen ligase